MTWQIVPPYFGHVRSAEVHVEKTFTRHTHKPDNNWGTRNTFYEFQDLTTHCLSGTKGGQDK